MKNLKFALTLILAATFVTAPLTAARVMAQDPQTQPQATAIVRGYRTGYSDGYQAGVSDRAGNATREFRTRSEYEKGDRAYNATYGPMEEYRDGLVARNMFVAHAPKAGGDAGGKDEVAAGAIFAWTDYGEYGWRMGVKLKDATELKYYHQGDDIEIGKLKGKIVQLDGRRVVIETAKGRVEVRFGRNFGEALPVEAPAA